MNPTESLRQRAVTGLHLGILQPGDRLKSIREVATEFGVNPRVVMASYRQLETEGLVRMRRRSGVFVESPPVREEEPLPDVAALLVDLFLRGLSRGISPAEVRRQARLCLNTVRLRVACLECNDDQIYALCRQVQEDYGFDAIAVDIDTLGRGRRLPPRVRDADLVLTTRFHEIEARRLGKRLHVPVVVATLDQVFINEVRRLLASGTVWWICTDPPVRGEAAAHVSRGAGDARRPRAASAGSNPARGSGLCDAFRGGASPRGLAGRPRRHRAAPFRWSPRERSSPSSCDAIWVLTETVSANTQNVMCNR